MTKMSKMKKVALAASLSLALTVGVSANATSAFAGYLAAPTQEPAGTSGSFIATYSTTSGNSFQLSYTGNSTYGNTIPVISSVPVPTGDGHITGIIDGGASNPLPPSDVFYNSSTLALKQIATTGAENYTATAAGIGTVTGQVISNVMQVGSGSTMSGAKAGDLVFTYQFDVLSVKPNTSGINLSQATVALFNNPGGSALWTLGAGVNVNKSGGQSALGSTLSCPGCTTASLKNLAGSVLINSLNGSVANLADSFNGGLKTDYISPQIFVATNALYYGVGSISLGGSGLSGSAGVFVPNSPEPSTLVLLGSGLALLSFLSFRRKENQLVI